MPAVAPRKTRKGNRVLIGIDPHKGSHTAVVVDRDEVEVARVKVRADRHQLARLLEFAAPYDRKVAEGKSHKEALRALKRRVSDAVYRQLVADANTNDSNDLLTN